MSSALAQQRAPNLLITGLYGLRDIVLALPRLTALRAQYPDARITMVAPVAARDLLLRLRIANSVRVLDDHSVFSVLLSGWWDRLRGAFDRIIHAATLAELAPVAWECLARDLTFVAPPQPYVLFAQPEGLPTLRAAALLRKLEVMGIHAAVVGIADTPQLARLRTAAPEVRDLVGRVDLSDIPALAAGAVAMIGGRDGMTALAALSGARTLVLTQGADDAVDVLPAANTIWLQSDDLSYIAVGDMIKAVMP